MRFVVVYLLMLFATVGAQAQRIAVLTPDDAEQSAAFAAALSKALGPTLRQVDESLARSAFRSLELENPYNLSTDDAKRAGTVIGCDLFVLVKASVQRRSASNRPEYYDGSAAVFLVSGRTGQLLSFDLLRTDALTPAAAESQLMALASEEASKLSNAAASREDSEMRAAELPPFAGPPEPGTPAALGFRSPVPYRRIKPEYTPDAALYDVRGSVDVEIDLSSGGHVEATRIKKWAGYGLDEAADRAINAMNWRPAERGGKPIALRFVMRFNFKRVEKE